MNKLTFILLAVLLVGVLVLGGCVSNQASTAQSTAHLTQVAADGHKILKIGSNASLTLPDGVGMKKWLDLFAKYTNDNGGLKVGNDTYDIQMIVYDDQGDSVKAKSNLEKLVLQDGCKYVLGGIFGVTGSGAGGPVDITVTESNKVLDISGDVTSVTADSKVQYYYAAGGTYFGQGLMYLIYTDMANKGVKSYVSLKPDNQMGHMGDDMCNPMWKLAAPDAKYLETVFYDPSTTDFGAIATKIMNLNPDVVDGNYAISSGSLSIYSALKNVGFKGTILPASLTSEDVDNIVNAVGKDYAEGGECYTQDPRGVQTDPEMLAIMDYYTKTYGSFSSDGLLQTGAFFVLRDAMVNTQSVDVEVLKKYLDNSNHAVMTLTGYTQLFARPDLGNYRTICGTPVDLLGVIQDGKLQTKAGVGPKTHYLSSILASGNVEAYKKYWEEYGYPQFPDQQSVINFSDLGIQGHD